MRVCSIDEIGSRLVRRVHSFVIEEMLSVAALAAAYDECRFHTMCVRTCVGSSRRYEDLRLYVDVMLYVYIPMPSLRQCKFELRMVCELRLEFELRRCMWQVRRALRGRGARGGAASCSVSLMGKVLLY